MKSTPLFLLLSLCLLFGCKEKPSESSSPEEIPSEVVTDGKMIPITTPKGTFNVWTKTVGNNPTTRVLLLHGGPGGSHEFFECFEDYFPAENIEYILYDQLDSYHSDKPNDTTLWTLTHFVDEVEQIRKALNLDASNFYLLGQSWGGILAMEYALKHQANMKGLIISNMMASLPMYEKYAKEVLGPKMDPEVFAEIMAMEKAGDYENPRYNELLMEHYYTQHIMRKPLEEWPEAVTRAFEHLNPEIYIYMQGYSEFGITGNASLKGWNFSERLPEISVPTLVIGGQYDTMDPDYLEWMSTQVQNGRSVTTNGSHLSQYDDPENYFNGVIRFIQDVDSGAFPEQ